MAKEPCPSQTQMLIHNTYIQLHTKNIIHKYIKICVLWWPSPHGDTGGEHYPPHLRSESQSSVQPCPLRPTSPFPLFSLLCFLKKKKKQGLFPSSISDRSLRPQYNPVPLRTPFSLFWIVLPFFASQVYWVHCCTIFIKYMYKSCNPGLENLGDKEDFCHKTLKYVTFCPKTLRKS